MKGELAAHKHTDKKLVNYQDDSISSHPCFFMLLQPPDPSLFLGQQTAENTQFRFTSFDGFPS